MLRYTVYTNLFRIDEATLKNIEVRARNGEPEALFALGRYHYCTNSNPDSLTIAKECFGKAQASGLLEADVALATMYRRGMIGAIDRKKANRLLQHASDNGCKYAIEIMLTDKIYGWNGAEMDVAGATQQLEELLAQEEYPMWYYLMGCAKQQAQDMDAAGKWYERAIEKGIIDACSDLAYVKSHNEDGEMINEQAYITYLKRGAEMQDGVCVTLLALCRIERYEEAGTYERLLLSKELIVNLERAVALGCNTAAYYLGQVYLNGMYGIDTNYDRAWKWFIRGTALLSEDCYECAYYMLTEGYKPADNLDSDTCALNGARCGSTRLAIEVAKAYMQGKLAEHAQEIEEYFIPIYNTNNNKI